MHDVIIIGSGPAGYTAAIYAARANLAPVVFASSVEAGGDLMTTTDVENFPGFPKGIQGPELMLNMQEQAERFGADVRLEDVTQLELDGDVKKVHVGAVVHEARTVIFATGSAYRKLGIPGGVIHPQVTAPAFLMYYCWMIRDLEDNPWTDRIVDPRYTWIDARMK